MSSDWSPQCKQTQLRNAAINILIQERRQDIDPGLCMCLHAHLLYVCSCLRVFVCETTCLS